MALLESVAKVADSALKLAEKPPKAFWGAALIAVLASTLVLFGPERLVSLLGFDDLVREHRAVIGAAWLGALSVLVASSLVGIGTWTQKEVKRRVRLRVSRSRLQRISDAEREVLRPFILKQTRTRELALNSGVVRELEAVGILWRPSEVSNADYWFDYNLQPWAWTYLNQHPELVLTAEETAQVQSPESHMPAGQQKRRALRRAAR